MTFFRSRFIAFSFLLVAGVSFLNMSFIVAEIHALKNAYNFLELANISKMISGSLLEEEHGMSKTSEGGETQQVNDLFEGKFLRLQFEYNNGPGALIHLAGNNNNTHSGFQLIFTPPPNITRI